MIIHSLKVGISPMPSNLKALTVLARHLPLNIDGAAYELGCGFGTVLPLLNRRYAEVIGFESSPFPYLVSKAVHSKVYRHDFFQEDLSSAGLIYCYLYPGAMEKLKGKFIKELRPGTHIFSNTFGMPGWAPTRAYQVNDLYHSKLYHWILSKSTK